ncbi:hypothetical protein [Secundilactobacillus odoratitofui]|uniref:hypothetical protein n=1 Tax=Secundilactobacillus odoratitofui TaxID=480930 RepID=UPI0006D051AD|nr:hypothetical protein [Secundilactobacillus odoratitofui]
MLEKMKLFLISIITLITLAGYFFICTPLGGAYSYVFSYDLNGFPHSLSYRFTVKYKTQDKIMYKLNKPFSDMGNYVSEFEGERKGIVWSVGPYYNPEDLP